MKNDQLDTRTSARLLKRAQAIKGGAEKLAASLGVTPQQLTVWTGAEAFPPQRIFEQVLEIILDAHERKLLSGEPASRAVAAERRSSTKPRALVAEDPAAFALISEILADRSRSCTGSYRERSIGHSSRQRSDKH